MTSNAIVKSSPTAGNGLFATNALEEGVLVIRFARPTVAVLDEPRLKDTCSHCFVSSANRSKDDNTAVESPKIHACTGCKVVGYCSKRCQSQSWKRSHKWECKQLPALATGPSATRAALQLRTLTAHDTISEDERHGIDRSGVNEETYQEMMRMICGSSEAYEHYRKSSARQDVEVKGYEHSMGKIMTNALTLVTSTFDPIGIAYHPLICSANHSCDPNVAVVFDGARLSLRSLRRITKGEELFISYVECTNPYQYRQEDLRRRYGFICRCTKCSLGSGQREDKFLGPLSQLKPELESIGLRQYDMYPSWRHAFFSSGDSNEDRPLQGLSMMLFDNLEVVQAEAEDSKAVQAAKNILARCHESRLWPLTRQPYAAARDELFARYCAVGEVSQALMEGIRRHFLIDPVLYPKSSHPVRVVHTWGLVRVLIWLYDIPEHPSVQRFIRQGFDFVVPIWRLLKEVTTQIDRSHGADSELAVKVKTLMEEVRMGITAGGQQNLRLIEADSGGSWTMFESWKNMPDA